MNISEAAEMTGLPVKTVRYYDDIGLVVAERSSNGYRNYGDNHINRLRFLQRSRSLGFSIEDCRSLLSLYDDADRASSDVRQLAQARIDEIDEKIRQLGSLRETLAELVSACHGDDRPDCPIIADLARSPVPEQAT